MTRTCYSCHRTLPIEKFYRDRTKKDGRSFQCSGCSLAKSSSYAAEKRKERVPRVRLCRCGTPTWSIKSRYCARCSDIALERRRRRGSGAKPSGRLASTKVRGYGTPHQKARKKWKAVVDAGRAHCARCGFLILPGTRWNLDHAPGKNGYLGPSHELCNKRAGGKLGAAITNVQKRARRRVSRQW